MDEFVRNFRKLWGQSLPFSITAMFAISGVLIMLYMAYRKLDPGG